MASGLAPLKNTHAHTIPPKQPLRQGERAFLRVARFKTGGSFQSDGGNLGDSRSPEFS